MAQVRSVDFLPEIFRTDTNKQFLAATLDQLIQEPKFKKTQGFIGRKVGPGVIPSDSYVVEPDKTRADYQLEPAVISLRPDSDEIQDAITYPGIDDAIGQQGGVIGRPDRLYTSEYYAWDPFVDFDSFVNFSQYYWLPNGPDAVDVSATTVLTTDTFDVTRGSTAYTFSGVPGSNPVIELVRGGSYNFVVAQNAKQTVNLRVNNQGQSAWLINNQPNPTLTLIRGNTYVFNVTARLPLEFWIKTAQSLGSTDAYSNGVTNNGATSGLVTFVVPQDAPDTLYYVNSNLTNLRGIFNIIDATPGTGNGFWIQSTPGVTGTIPSTPNISSRDVFGVSNNGEDLGVITFNVPQKTAQEFYFNLATFTQPVDLVTDLRFDQINNQPLDEFIAEHNGIDGVSYLAGRTLIFVGDPQLGWTRTTLFDPLAQGSANDFLEGSFDTTLFDQALTIPVADRTQLWQIQIVSSNNIDYINLVKAADIPALNRWTIRYGNQYASTNWYKNTLGRIDQIPLLTAQLDTLYYQDATDPFMVGEIRLLDPVDASTLFMDDVLGQPSYTSPNGVTFTNGLKVVFRGDIVPASYASNTFTIECTGTLADFNAIITDSTEGLYEGQPIVFGNPAYGGLIPAVTYYVHTVINPFQFTVTATMGGQDVVLDNSFASFSATLTNYREYYVSGVGSAIKLLPVTDFVTPETYVVDDDTSTLIIEPAQPDYITIDRASLDLNAWTRSNRWFHIDVVKATADYNDTVAELDNNKRAKRPILQFRPNLRLYNMGTQGLAPVDIIDVEETDALSNINGSTGYTTQGYTFVNGTRVIFQQDADPEVRNKIFQVEFITPDTVPPLTAQPVINLTLAPDGDVVVDQAVVCLYGTVTAGQTYWYNGDEWVLAQQKTGIQQAPLFNIYDANGISLGDEAVYPSSNFDGSKLFSYAVGDTAIPDPVLQFPLQYLNITNIGDIVFDNNLYKDSITYTRDNVSSTLPISTGYVREYSTRTKFERLLGWQPAVTPTQQYQQFQFQYDGTPLQLDVRVADTTSIPAVKIFVESVFKDPGTYTITRNEQTSEIALDETYAPGTILEVLVLSDQTSQAAFYQVPVNLENNPLNVNSESFTLGTIRTHYQSLCENLPTLVGPISGANNTRDLGNIVPWGLTILQQSAPLTLAGYFLRSQDYNIFNSLVYNGREYVKYRNLILENVTQQLIQFETAAQILDTAVETLTAGKVDSQPFYWTDMLPSGAVYQETVYPVTFITTDTFDLLQVYDYETQNYRGFNVYVNDVILVRNRDYVVATDGPRFTVLIPLSVGDTVTVREYQTTYGSFCPSTPTKLGLYPAWYPEIVTETTSTGSATVIIGHDGSVTPVFGDIRDDVLLEFERRIYNNIKMDGNPVPLLATDVIPGQFRDTGYSFDEIQGILNTDFLSYVAWNKLAYREQEYSANNAFTYNYSTATNKLDSKPLLGAWRGIYRYFYDTQQPQSTPWEMLGLSLKPLWWDDTYGAAPYTAQNLNLWDDLEAGIVRDPAGPYVVAASVRPGLTQVIPTGSQGSLEPPLNVCVKNFNSQQFRRSWAPGDGGPVEASWWNSSLYPFAVMRLLALTRPAKFFALFADRDLYRYNEEFQQYLYDQRYRLDANGIEVYGDGVAKASYINWIVDYNRQTGLDSTRRLTNDLASLDVRLAYRMASFSDKQYIKLFTEKASPDSTNTSFLIPDESYDLLLYKNQPFDRAAYSSVLIQRSGTGYQIFGYSTLTPFFTVKQSQFTGQLRTISVAGAAVRVPTFYTGKNEQVPYGQTFDNTTAVADFLLSYGRWLEEQGLVFGNFSNGYPLTWDQMVVEFLYWSEQGWDENAVLALNPLSERLSITKEQAVVDDIQYQTLENVLLDQDRRQLSTRNLNIVRIDNTFSVEPLTDQTLSYLDVNYTSYEHMIVLDNVSVFGDLIFEPATGARQSRLNLVAVTSTEWNGSVNAQGFILNQDNVEEWQPERRYTKGEIVRYKDAYWSAATIVQPAEQFDYNDWLQSDYEQIEQGLLPNLANKANQLANSYNVNVANLEVDNDLFSYGLIGFRPRQYMTSLRLDDTSQVNVYRQFLKTKGTQQAVELFSQADLGKENADYNVFENWAVQRAVYGANANRSFFELRLNRALLDANPSLIQIIQPQQASSADQTVLLSDVWRQSFRLTSPDVLPVTTEVPTDTALPSAGYVSLDDVDITVFDLNDPTSLSANIDRIAAGTTVWAAKVNDYDWNVYESQSVPGYLSHVCDNLDGTSLAIFTEPHGLEVGQQIIIKFFESTVDGVYRVLSVPSLQKITIQYQFTGNQAVVNGTGIVFYLTSLRVAQLSDIADLPGANSLTFGSRVWADDNGSGRWTVVEKQSVFQTETELQPKVPDEQEGFGTAVAQAAERFAALVGSPNYDRSTEPNTKGAVYVYVKNFDSDYQPVSPTDGQDTLLRLEVSGARGYGNAVDFGYQDWAVAGASRSLGPNNETNCGYACVIYRDAFDYVPGQSPYFNWQLLTNPDGVSLPGQFGHSVAMSDDERWLFVGAPGVNRVYCYGRVDWQNQVVKVTGDGETTVYGISDAIQIDAATQIQVTVFGAVQVLGVDYTVSAGFDQVLFTTAPPLGSLVEIQRLRAVTLDASAGPTYSLNEYFFGIPTVNSFSVFVDGVLQRPNIDYDYNADDSSVGQDLTFINVPAPGSSILVKAQDYWQFADSVTVQGLSADAQFGYSVACSTDGRQIVVGTPDRQVSGQNYAGSVYVFDRSVQRFIYGTDPSSVAFTVSGSVTGPVSVLVNGNFLINEVNATINAPNSFVVAGNTVTLNTDLDIGDNVEIETNQFSLLQSLTQPVPAEFSNLGQAVEMCPYDCTIYAGAPQSSVQTFKGGVVERWINGARIYGSITSTQTNPVLTPGDTIRVNNIEVAVPAPAPTISGLAAAINSSVPNVTAQTSNGRLLLTVTNLAASTVGNRLSVLPGSVGSAFDTIGFDLYTHVQTIESPYPVEMSAFGCSLDISETAAELVVGNQYGTMYLVAIFDDGTTDFDANATDFFSDVTQSGTVYVYDLLPASNGSVSNPDQFVFGQQMSVSTVDTYDQFGAAVSYRSGLLWTGAPGTDLGDSSSANFGHVYIFQNPNRASAWSAVNTQQPTVDIRLLNSVFLYDRVTSATTEFLDFFNPLQGKILGAARQNIDYIGAKDPASYNVGPVNQTGTTWAAAHVGEMWWDISTVRFIDPNQDSITYASRRWGQIFPGSRVDVYQWIVSDAPPALYTGPGTPLDTLSYSVNSVLDNQGVINTQYFFWVRNITTVSTAKAKTLSAEAVSRYIQSPQTTGISYLAPINASTVAIYNCADLIEAQDTVLHIEFDREYTNDNVHVEYELIAQGRGDDFLSDNLYRKLQDSLCGVDTAGNLVPDLSLSPAERYGVQFRPRQSMFADRFVALENYVRRTNEILARYPISEIRSFNLLNSKEPEPSAASGLWNQRVANLDILSFQNLALVPVGYRYLVATDSSQRGLWTIYTVQLADGGPTKTPVLTRVQAYYTPDYWSYIDWYRPGYNSSVRPVLEVPNVASLDIISVAVGSSVKVTANAQNKFEIYLRTDLGFERVGLEDGTIEISAEIYDYALGRFGFDLEVFDAQYFDQEPVTETRKIIQAINQELLIDDLAIERNNLLVLMFNYVLTEFAAPEWLVKTSLIDVDHRIRELLPFPNFVRDNQEFVIDYIQEVKPYHVQVREFNLQYFGTDIYQGDVTDFDLPAYYNTALTVPQFVSPILTPYEASAAQISNNKSNTPPTSALWEQWPYSQWYGQYLLELTSIFVTQSGSGYTEAPVVTIQGDAVTPATAVAVINGSGQVIAVNITDPGSGYRDAPVIVFTGGNGSGAQAYARLTNSAVRQFRTIIRYDRYQYQTAVQTWTPEGLYENGTLVRYDDRVWEANSTDSTAVTGPTFDFDNWQLVNAATYQYPGSLVPTGLSGVDRTMGLYVAGVDAPGLELPLLIEGTDYPGVQVWGDYFLGSSPEPLLVTCTQTSSSNNAVVCANTQYVQAGTAVKFTGATFGGVLANAVYYVHAVISPTEFSLSLTDDGLVLPLTDASGTMSVILPQILDVNYQSSFGDIFLGTRATDINVDGGEFIGTFEGHAPPELVNGSEFDTLDMRVYTRPGSDWQYDGHGFDMGSVTAVYDPVTNPNWSWDGLVRYPVQVFVANATTGLMLYDTIDYTVNWLDRTIDIIPGPRVSTGDLINVTATEVGGGSELYKATLTGADAPGGQFVVPVDNPEILAVGVFVNGVIQPFPPTAPYIVSEAWSILVSYPQNTVVNNLGIYYRAVQTVPIGTAITDTSYWQSFVPTLLSQVTMITPPAAGDALTVIVFGVPTASAGNFVIGKQYTIETLGNTNWLAVGAPTATVGTTFTATGRGSGTGTATTFYSWASPYIQTAIADTQTVLTQQIALINVLDGTNVPNMIVNRNGLRLNPPAGIQWLGDGTSVSFGLPQRLGASFQQSAINNITDIQVWVDDILQTQAWGSFTGQYYVTPWDGSNTPGRQVVFYDPPVDGAHVYIAVSTLADYTVIGDQLTLNFVPNLGDEFGIITYNDTSQQDLATLVFVGPEVSETQAQEPFDSTDFDDGLIDNEPGSFDYSQSNALLVNNFYLQRPIVNAERMFVTLDGYRLFEGRDFSVKDDYLILASGPIGLDQTLAVTLFTQSVVPAASAFHIFQDMRGVQAVYRYTDSTTTQLSQALSATADEIFVTDASALSQPNLVAGVFGVVFVGAERILYRERDTANNTVSGLQRGTAGTAAQSHPSGTTVYNGNRGNLLADEYQNYVVSNTATGDGTTAVFTAPDISAIDFGDSSLAFEESIEVYVGGTRQYRVGQPGISQYPWSVTATLPLQIQFETDPDPTDPQLPPPDGVEILILQRRGVWWYDLSTDFTRNQALQETDTIPARFLTGR